MSAHCWVWITPLEELPLREGRVVSIGGREVALFNLGDRVLAVDNKCPHQGGPLADGIVSGETVVCPLHAWKINLADGLVERPSGVSKCVRSYPTRLDNGLVVIGLPADEAATAGEAA